MVFILMLAAGCAGGGGDVETADPWPGLETMEDVRHFFDSIGPNPAGVDTFTYDWRSRSGPTEEGPPLDWGDRFVEDLDFSLGEEWDPLGDMTSNLVLTGSVMGTTSNPPGGHWRLGANFNSSFEDGTWLSVGLYGGESFHGVDGFPANTVSDFGMDLHVRANLAVYDDRTRSFWLLGARTAFYRWGGGKQVNYGSGYGGLGIDLPLGERTYLLIQGTLGLRWSEYPFESMALEAGVDVGVIIPLSGPAKPD